MASTILVDKIDPQSGTALELGSSGDTLTVPSGATLAIASGATLTNSGTATGVGGNNTPAFNVKISSNQDVSSGTTTVVAFNSEQVDTDNAFNTSNYRFVPQTAGKYFIAFTIYALTASAGNANLRAITANIRKNGSNQTQVVQDYNSSFIRQGCATTTAVIDMNGSTDYIDFTADATELGA